MTSRIRTALKEQWAGSEFSLHRFTVDLLRLTAKPRVLWLHIPNGEYRSPRTGARLKAMGVRKGAGDLLIIVRGVPGFLELKNAAGRQSADQLAFEADARGAAARYAIARSPEAVRDILEAWGAIEPARSVNRVAA